MIASTSAARDYAENFHYRAWRDREVARDEASIEKARNDLAYRMQALKDKQKLPLDA